MSFEWLTTVVISLVLNVCAGYYVWFSKREVMRMNEEHYDERMDNKLKLLDLEVYVAQLQHQNAKLNAFHQFWSNQVMKPSNDSSADIDQTTQRLIELAVNNPNDNEARNAAIQACKRLSKRAKS